MKRILLLAASLLSLSTYSANETAADETATSRANTATEKSRAPLASLLQQIDQYQSQEAGNNKAREQRFLRDVKAREQLLREAKAALKVEKDRAAQLKKAFDSNEQQLAEREEELRLRVGNLGEMFGVVRQTATDLNTVIDDSLTITEQPQRRADLDKLAEAKELPTIRELEDLWYTLQQEMILNGQITEYQADVIGRDGTQQARQLTRLGVFNAISEQGYFAYDSELNQLRELGRQPQGADLLADYLNTQNPVAAIALDPSRGALLNMTLESPDLAERIQQGALVGYIILTLGAVGLLIAAWRTSVLLKISSAIARQKQNMTTPSDDNPLGRVLRSWHELPKPIDVDVLEARMDEAVLRELPALERGQTIIKLFAGIAPLLGLLGTVTGMIATFQAITNFGAGDPKLMASGISQALITTVLGLIAAIPLLLAHSWVASRSKALIQLLDEQSAGLMAEALENQQQNGRS